jgi:hypothetical protein
MYGLPQEEIIALALLAKRLKEHGYSQSKTTPRLWKHKWRPIIFSLVFDNSGVKYVSKEHAQHLLQTVQKYYKCLLKEEGEQYCGLTIKWDYPGKKVHLSMPLYAKNGLKQFQHPPLIVLQDQPHPHIHKTYGAKVQQAKANNNPPPRLIRRGKNSFRKSPEYSFFLRKQWI